MYHFGLIVWLCCSPKMDTGLVCERPYQLFPRASELRSEVRPITRDSSPKREKCCHFSIRGHVAEVLKSDRKICWPFHDYINREKQENLLPPISVTEFRWWDCQNCLNKTSARENGEMTKRYACINVNAKETFTDEISIMASQRTTSNFLYGQDEISERTLNGQSIERNCFPVTNSSIRSYPFVPSSNVEKKSSNDHEDKEATHTCTSGNDVIGEGQIQNMNMSSDDAVKHNQQNSERHNTLEVDRFTSCSNPSMVFSKLPFRKRTQITIATTNDESSPLESKVLLERNREFCKAAYTEKGTRLPQSMTNSVDQIITKDGRFVTSPMNRKFRHLPERVNNYFQKDVAQKLDKPHLLGTKLKQLDEGKCYASVKDGMNGRRNEGHHVNQHLYPSKHSSKKIRKTRTLNDILKSEVLGIDEKIPASDGKLKDHAYLKCDAFKEGDACKVQKHSNAFQKEKIKVLKRKKREQMPESEEEEFPLMHWVTKTPSKTKIVKLHTENKDIGRLYIVPKPSESIPFQKPTSFTMKPCQSSRRDGRVSGINKHPDDARFVFEEIPVKNTVCLNALMAGYSNKKLWDEGLGLVRLMHGLGFESDGFTLSTVLRMCAELPSARLGMQAHAYLLRSVLRLELDVFVQSCLVEMYGRCGIVPKARLTFDMAVGLKRDVVLWTSMLNAYGRNGLFDDVVATFEEMLAKGNRPDEIAFMAVISACSRMGHVAQGLGYFESMSRDYGIVPWSEHNSCVMDLLCRAGELDKAWKFANEVGMNSSNTAVSGSLWGALLSACKDCGNVEMGRVTAQRALELDPGNVRLYIELSNLYAAVGMWDEIDKLRELIKGMGMKKDAGCSWLEVTSSN